LGISYQGFKGDITSKQLIKAVEENDITLVRSLIDRGANINIKNDAGMPLLNIAILKDNTEIAKLLLSNGADYDAMDITGKTALDLALAKDYEELTELLLAKGAKIETNDVPIMDIHELNTVSFLQILLLGIFWSSVILALWIIFIKEGWPGWACVLPFCNLFVITIIIVRTIRDEVTSKLKESLFVLTLSIVSMVLILNIATKNQTSIAFMNMLFVTAIGGFIFSWRFGNEDNSVYIPAALNVLTVIVTLCIGIVLLVIGVNLHGEAHLDDVLLQELLKCHGITTRDLYKTLRMGMFLLVVSLMLSVPYLFAFCVIGAWIGKTMQRIIWAIHRFYKRIKSAYTILTMMGTKPDDMDIIKKLQS
jgi:hypothetical protein